MSDRSKTRLRRLRARVARLLDGGERGRDVRALLDALAREAEPASEEALFAHRQLAELRLDAEPWRAALHLRQLVRSGAADDGVHALMGLSFALLGSFRAAVAAYRRALALAPNNACYHHNLGHLLDVGLGEPAAALAHLRRAHEVRNHDPAITDSLARCLARLGKDDEARALSSSFTPSRRTLGTPRRGTKRRRGARMS